MQVTEAKAVWASKLESMGNSLHQLAVQIQYNFGEGGGSRPQQIGEHDGVIAALLSLFSAENNRTVTDCLALLDSHDEATLRFYIPQLTTFLLFGGTVSL